MFGTSMFSNRYASYQKSIGSTLRGKRISPLLNMIESFSKNNNAVNIIDVGGTEQYWNIVPKEFLEAHNVNITIVNILGSHMPEDHDQFKFIEADGCELSQYADKSFHIAHSNSVVEHVGDWTRMVKYSREISRISQMYFVQTPNFWFPLEPHCATLFFHWLPKPIRVQLVLHFKLGNWRKAASISQAVRKVESARLLNKAMFQELFREATVQTEKLFWLPKSFVAIKTAQ